MNAAEPRAPLGSTPVDLTVVIVSHNTSDLLRECLQSLAALRRGGESSSFDVVVVDNDSRDESARVVREEFPWVELMANRVNVGYSRAVNQALRVAEGRYFLVLNPDVRVKPGAMDGLVRFMDENPRAGVAGGRLLNPDGTLQFSCRSFYTFRTLLYRRTFLGRLFPRSRVIRDHLMADWDHAAVRPVDWVLGACMMVRREAIQEVGLMDERFFLYFEDVDWCYRMKRRGWEVYYVPQAEMVHHHRRQSAQGLTDPRFLNHLNSVFHFYDKWNRALFAVKRYRLQIRPLLFLLSDLIGVNVAFLAAYLVRYLLGRWLVKPLFPLATYTLFLVFVNVTTVLSFYAAGLYHRRTGEREADELLRLAKAVSATFLILMAGTFLAQTKLYSRSMIYFFWPLAWLATAGGRLVLSRAHRRLRELRFDLRRVLLVGTGPATEAVERELRANPQMGYEVVGTVGWEREAGSPGQPGSWHPEDIPRIMREEQVEEVILVHEGTGGEKLSRLILECRARGAAVTLLSGATELVALGGRPVELGGREALGFEPEPWRAPAAFFKRAGDLAAACVGLLLFPFFLAAALARDLGRRREGGRHVGRRGFQCRRAWGRGGREFDLVVFGRRSLKEEDAEASAEAPSWGIPPRQAWPQVWNVLRGEMSLVGPRPRAAAEGPSPEEWRGVVERFRPGITGAWRVASGSMRVKELDRAARLAELDEVDHRYVRNWSLWLDLRILVETILGSGD